MEREFRITADGSHTLFIPGLKEPYHSMNGALTESKHIFIRGGLDFMDPGPVSILEFGFGTGLNALLTAIEAAKRKCNIRYTTLEKYPLGPDEVRGLNYPGLLGEGASELFTAIHEAPWEEEVALGEYFTLRKLRCDFRQPEAFPPTDLVYFDAFAPDVQPALWSDDLFVRIAAGMRPGAVLVTYSAKGSVKRSLQAAGFHVQKLPGPPGKREMIRAVRSE
ncbi:MAG: tRNA (5-methylaminomethyl-2-thiouridine)(34)-methyltransferase MnmD [Bacteroidota bacterium]